MRRLFKLAGRLREKRGDALVEFTVSAVVFLTILFGIMDFARAVYIDHFVSHAAQDGTRYAIVRGGTWASNSCATTATMDCAATAADIQSYIRGIAPPGVTASSVNVATTWPGTTISGASAGCSPTNTPGCLVKVSVSYNFSFLLPFMPTAGVTFTSTSEQVIQE